MARQTERVRVGDRTIELSNLDKLLWPEAGVTKADLIHYVYALSHRLLPQLRDRPLTVTRFPDGVHKPGFFQKDCPDYAPDWIKTFAVTSKRDPGKVTRFIVPEEPAALVWLANQAAIEHHPWMSTISAPSCPDYAVIDLDPNEGASFDDVRSVAALVKDVLDHLGLEGYPKLSGATGIHVYVPLERKYTYEETSAFAGYVGAIVARALPEQATNERLIKNRGPRVYVDHLQNLPGKTVVSAFSPRPGPRAAVSTPFLWDELESVTPAAFTLNDIDAILKRPATFDFLSRRRQNIDAHLQAATALQQGRR